MNNLKVFKILNKKEKRKLFLIFFLMIIGSFVELLGVSLILPLVNIITTPEILNGGIYQIVGDIFNLNDSNEYILFFSVILIIVYALKNLYLIFEYNIQYKFVFDSQKEMMSRLLRCYLREDYSFHVKHNPAELLRNTTTDVGTSFEVVQAFLQIFTEGLVCLILVVYLLYTDFISTSLIAIILVVFTGLFSLFYKKYSYKIGIEVRDAHTGEIKWINQAFFGIKEVKVTDSENYFINMFYESADKNADARRKQSLIGYLSKPVMETVMICGLLGTLFIKVKLGGSLISLLPLLSVFVVSAYRMLPSFNRITSAISVVMYGKSAVNSVYNELLKFDTSDLPIIKDEEKSITSDDDILIKNLSFSYDERNDYVLDDVSFKIERKKSTAFIGESGAGKSTLADLLLGVLKPVSGDIEFNGESIYKNLVSWHKSIGYIPQSIYLIDDNILRNVAFGIDDKAIDLDNVWKVLKEAQLDSFVRSLPDGLYTQIGDRGVRLSGGQRQRIGIARALYNNPKLLIMDEATSALDNETESGVMEAIDSMQGTRTIIIIAHRLTTIRNCDVIYRVENKKIQKVSHSEVFKD